MSAPTPKEILEKHAKLNPDSAIVLSRSHGQIGVDINVAGDPATILYFLHILKRHGDLMVAAYEKKTK